MNSDSRLTTTDHRAITVGSVVSTFKLHFYWLYTPSNRYTANQGDDPQRVLRARKKNKESTTITLPTLMIKLQKAETMLSSHFKKDKE